MATSSKPCETYDELGSAQAARDLELRTAERDGAVALVDTLARIIEKQGGYLSPEDQIALHDAVQLAQKHGVRKAPYIMTWSNRP